MSQKGKQRLPEMLDVLHWCLTSWWLGHVILHLLASISQTLQIALKRVYP